MHEESLISNVSVNELCYFIGVYFNVEIRVLLKPDCSEPYD